MRGGLIISVAFHLAVLIALVVGLPFLDTSPKPAAQPIPVEVVRLSPESSTPKGAKPEPETKKTPDADKSTTAEPAKRDPNAGDKGRDAKTAKVETPPKPEPKPVKKAEAKPAPKPAPKPEPKPVKKAEVKPAPKPEPKAPAPKAEVEPAPKPERKKQVAEATPPKPKDETAEPEKKRRRIAARPQFRPKPPKQLDRKPEPETKSEKKVAKKKRGDVKSMDSVFKTVNQFKRETRKTDKTDQTAQRKPVGSETAKKGAPLTISEIDAIRRQIQPCWNFPAGARNPENLRVLIRLRLRPDGSLISAEVKDRARMATDGYYRAAAEAALRAVRNPQCSPLRLPAAKYDQWKSLTVEFDPAKLKAG